MTYVIGMASMWWPSRVCSGAAGVGPIGVDTPFVGALPPRPQV
jgi:hypothetical protein